MHYLHLILVQASDADDARDQAEDAIELYGDGDVWDYHEAIGGVWADDLPAGPVSLLRDRKSFMAALAHAREFQRGSLANFLRFLTPQPNAPLDPQDVGRRAGAVFEKMTQALLSGQMPTENLAQAIMADAPVEPRMVNYAMRKALQLAAGAYTSHSHFFDALRCSSIIMTDAEVENATAEEVDLWIVPMDLHN